MKKVLAIILSIAMLFSVLAINTYAEANPTVTVITNAGSPIAEGVHTYLTVRFDNFASIKGMDITIAADGAELGEVDVTGFNGLVENENFTEVNTADKHEIHIVDLTGSSSTGKITFEVTAPAEDALITVSGKYADSGKTLFNIADALGNLEVKKEVVVEVVKPEVGEEITEQNPVVIEQPAEVQDQPKKFIPYGSVYKEVDGEFVYADKDQATGSFTVTEEGYQVQSFDVPENGITTFGVSENTEVANTIRFGSYSEKVEDADFHGTMIFEGDWMTLKNYYIQKGYSVQQFVEAIYKNYDKTMAANPEAKYVYYTLKGKTIKVYKFKQQKHMWKSSDNKVLEYALRVGGLKDNETYTGVAYSEKDGVPTISAEVKSVTRPAAQ